MNRPTSTKATPARVERLTFGKNHIPLTPEEFRVLSAALADYIATTGTNFGFIRSLLRGV